MRGGPPTRGLHVNRAATGHLSRAHPDADLAEPRRILDESLEALG